MRSLTRTHRFLLGAAALAGILMAAPVIARADADVSVALKASTDLIHYGETATYTATLDNLGPSVATGVEISDIGVVAPLVLKSVSGCTPLSSNAAGVLVPCTVDDGQLIDEPVPATPQFQKTVTFDVELPVPDAGFPSTCPDGSGLSAVSVTVTTVTTDPTPGNNTASVAALTIGTLYDLAIAMTAPGSASIGQTIDVGAMVTNNGPCTATSVAADDEQGLTTLTLGFLSADGDCDQDPLAGTCEWPSLAPGESKVWTIHYKVLGFPSSLMQSGEPVSLTVYSNADDTFDTNPDNDTAVTQTIVSKSVGACNTGGGIGGTLSLLLLAAPFLRRRRKS